MTLLPLLHLLPLTRIPKPSKPLLSFFQNSRPRLASRFISPVWLLGGAVVIFGTGLLATAQEPASVVLAPIVADTVTSTGNFVGTVMPVRRSIIGSAVEGRVIQYDIDAGQAVGEDDTLAQLLTETVDIELAGARAEERLREAELAELVNGALPEEIAQAEARLAAAQALETYTRSRLTRTQELARASGAISQEELDLARSEFLSAEQERVEAEESLALLRMGPREERIAQANARLAMQSQVVALLEDRKSKFWLRSPFDGYVVREYTEEGAWIKVGDPVAEVIDIDPVEIEINVPEGSVRFLQPGMPVTVRLDAIPGQEFVGTLSQIIPEADIRARTFPFKIRIPNHPEDPRLLLRPGMLARAILPTSESAASLLAPKDAVVFGGPTPIVWKNDGGVAQPITVTVGAASGNSMVVSGDLQPGDQVVIRGNEGLRPGQAIRAAK